MKYKFILFSPWLLKSPVKVGALNPKAFGANLGLLELPAALLCVALVGCFLRFPFGVLQGFSQDFILWILGVLLII